MAKDMTVGNPTGLIVRFTIPLLIGNIFQQLYSMADTFIVGRTLGLNALAAVGATSSITFFILGFAQGLTAGLAIPLAQKFGAKDMSGVKKSFWTSIVISIVVGVFLTILSVWQCQNILTFMQTPAEIIDLADQYLVIIFGGIFSSMAFNLLSNILRSLGDSKTPLYFLVVACVINIVLDYTLIVFFGTGVAGAAYATVFSQFFAALCCLVFILKKIPLLHMQKQDRKLDSIFLRHHARIAFPMAFQSSIIAIGSIAIQVTVNQLGPIAVAAFSASQKIDQLALLPMMSFGVTMATYAAQNYGARLYDRIWKGVHSCIKLSGSFSLVIGALLITFSSTLIGLFVGPGQAEVIHYGQLYFYCNASMYFVLSLLFIYRYTLQGLGKSFAPTFAGVMELVMRLFAAIFLSRLFGFSGSAIASPLAWMGSAIPLAITYYATKRKISNRSLSTNF